MDNLSNFINLSWKLELKMQSDSSFYMLRYPLNEYNFRAPLKTLNGFQRCPLEGITVQKRPFWLRNWNRLLILILSIAITALASYGTLDKTGRSIVDDAFNQALIVFGSAKALNAVVSLAQGTEIGPPGVTIAVGEVLDPVNDLIERFSWIMLASITSLGIQTIFMNIVTNAAFNTLLLIMIIVYNLWLFVRFDHDERARNLLFKVTVIMVFLRFSVPLMSLANDLVYHHFVQPEYNIAQLNRQITAIENNVTKLNESALPQQNAHVPQSTWEEISSYWKRQAEIFDRAHYKKRIDAYSGAVEKASDHMIDLIIAFVFQTIIFPLLFLFLLYKLVLRVFDIGR